MSIGILDGYTPLEQISLLHLENALGIRDLMIPLSTSYTQSSSSTDPINGGRPTVDDSNDLSDEGSATREK